MTIQMRTMPTLANEERVAWRKLMTGAVRDAKDAAVRRVLDRDCDIVVRLHAIAQVEGMLLELRQRGYDEWTKDQKALQSRYLAEKFFLLGDPPIS